MKRIGRCLIAVLGWCLAGIVWAHGDEDHGAERKPPLAAAVPTQGEAAAARRLHDGSLWVPKPVQSAWQVRTVQAQLGEVPAAAVLMGRVVVDPQASGRVQATQAGRIEPGPNGLAMLGQKVRKGQVLATLRPLGGSIERGNQQAQGAELAAQVQLAQRKMQRYAQLEGAVPQASIDAARIEHEALVKRLAAVQASLEVTELLRAPVSGVVSTASAVAGQVVEARELLFEVVDPTRLGVEALAYDFSLAQEVTTAAVPLDRGAVALTYLGSGGQLREQALPLLFRVQAGPAGLVVGQSVQVVAQTSNRIRGAVVPASALVKTGAGESAVWVHTEAERFVLRRVSAQALDAQRVVLTRGVGASDRVVSEGAALLSRVR